MVWVADLHLTEDDRDITTSGALLYDRLVDAVKQLVAKHVGSSPAQTSLLGQSRFSAVDDDENAAVGLVRLLGATASDPSPFTLPANNCFSCFATGEIVSPRLFATDTSVTSLSLQAAATQCDSSYSIRVRRVALSRSSLLRRRLRGSLSVANSLGDTISPVVAKQLKQLFAGKVNGD